MDMKLNKYIYSKMLEVEYEALPWTEDDIEEWISTWYEEVYERKPPMWLAGNRWYDRRARKIKEAKEAEAEEVRVAIYKAEARSYEKDEV